MDKVIFHRRFEKVMPILTLLILCGLIFFISPEFTDIRNKLTGFQTINTTAIVLIPIPDECNTTYEAGWNLISVACTTQTNTSINYIMDSIDGEYQSIHSYAGDLSSDSWKVYNPNLPSWVVQDLSDIDRKQGYWIYMYNQSNYYLQADIITPNLISLSTGWNLVGYPSLTSQAIETSTSGLEPNFEYFYLYNATDTSDYYKQYTWNTSLPSPQDLNRTVPHYGYWVYMYSPDTWVIV